MKAILWLELETKQGSGQIFSKSYQRKIFCLWFLGSEGYNIWRGTVR